MRLKEDSSSWKSRGIMRRDFRHIKGDPEVPDGHPKHRKKKPKKPKRCHHEWIEVTFEEYAKGGDGMYWWRVGDDQYTKKWRSCTIFYLCGHCLKRHTVTDKAKERKAFHTPFRKGPRVRGAPVSRRQFRY
jgi:hypothetical protein